MTPSTQKILYIITKSNFGGAQRYVYDLATNLPEEYTPVVALGGTGGTGDAPGMLYERLTAAGIATKIVPHFMRNMSLMDDMRAFVELWNIVRTEKPDVLHVTSSKAGGTGALIGRICRVPSIVFTSHGLTFDESWRPGWQRTLIYFFTWLTIFLSTCTILISRDTYKRARSMPFVGKKVTLIHNGIHTPDFLPRNEAQQTLLPGLSKSVYEIPWLGTIAEYHPNKNLGALIKAIALLKERGTATHLILIGEEGDGRAHLEQIAKEHNVSEQVHLLGVVNNAATYLQALDIFTLPSKKEGLPYVLLEAGLAALPVVVSNISGNTEIVTHEKTGLVVEPTAEHLANAFSTLFSDPARSLKYAEALHTDVQNRFSVKKMIQDTVRSYQIVATRPQ